MTVRVNLALVMHNHQPVDNPDEIIESVYKKAYLPFLEKLSRFPEVKANLHYSGYLLEWIGRKHPEMVDLMRRMVRSGQVEVLGGGYYEPILPVIPDRDALGQLRRLSETIAKTFGREPTGVWTAERAWEPHSPELLESAGVGYTLLDDTIFARSGVSGTDSCYPYLVESRGSSVAVFPMSKTLRYAIPWKGPSETIAYLRGAAEESGERIVVFGDDGEKFGAWPTTHELVYREGWLERFLKALVESRDWLDLVTLSGYLSKSPAPRRTYLPAASYDEMMEWSLPAEGRAEPSGFWRLFLAKYPESGRLYSKMLAVSRMVGDSGRSEDARTELWKGQCNDAYWHGVFGGLYSPVLRRITYHHILTAQRMAEAGNHGEGPWMETRRDFLDGRRELSIETRALSVRVCPDVGGSLAELGFKPAGLNLFDVIARRRERYHEKVKLSGGRGAGRKARSIHDTPPGKPNLRDLLSYDRYPRHSFLDHLVSPETGAKEFSAQSFRELVPLAGSEYRADLRRTHGGVDVALARRTQHATVEKTLRVDAAGSSLRFRYRVRFEGSPPTSRLLVQVNLGSLGDPAFARRFSRPRSLARPSSAVFDYPSLGTAVTLELGGGPDLWLVPILTVSQSESGFESILQGISAIPNLELSGKEAEFEVRLSVRRSRGGQDQY